MSLIIKNEEVVSLARQIADLTGENVTQAVAVALRERLENLKKMSDDEVRKRILQIQNLSNDAATRWAEPYGSGDHGDLIYEEIGLPKWLLTRLP